MPAAAGGPKGLVLGPLDRFLFGEWLPRSDQPIDLVGASIGAWRMANACMADPAAASRRFEHDYIREHYAPPPGRTRPSAADISAQFARSLDGFYRDRIDEVLRHPRYRLHVVTARGRHLLRREHTLATPLGYLGAFASNALHRRALGAWIERVVFSSGAGPLPFATADFPTRQVPLGPANFREALQASCSIPFVLRAVPDIDGAPRGAYWDGGITDYHLHLRYGGAGGGIVLYPHFQQAVVPGWLDKGLRWRHRATPALDRMVVLAPHPDWVRTLPNGRLPDRRDFAGYGHDVAARVADWSRAVSAAEQLADEWAAWLERPALDRVLPL
ncbi:phospholipase [uncultured Xylophilus sp.]|uniref:phospholipase n=1 Tax=uncultured Xylophilus sp. TaxID=296832 RepID=UPI0025CE04AD|nr:phospholipase [uncultured Xylophilus sp.]